MREYPSALPVIRTVHLALAQNQVQPLARQGATRAVQRHSLRSDVGQRALPARSWRGRCIPLAFIPDRRRDPNSVHIAIERFLANNPTTGLGA